MARLKQEWSKWYLVKDGSNFYVRRYRTIEGKTKWERMDRKQYAHIQSEFELKAYVKRLNHRADAELAKAKARL